MAESSIEWTHYTFNPWHGCNKVSPGCERCYAASIGNCFGVKWGPNEWRKIKTDPAFWEQPLLWNNQALAAGERRRVFALSMGDWLDDQVELIEPLARLLKVIRDTPALDWLLLTKRPQWWTRRMQLVMHLAPTGDQDLNDGSALAHQWLYGTFMPNVWVLASCESQEWADIRITRLLQIPAAVHGVSCEPLLGPIDLQPWIHAGPARISWVIAGGESGPGARPCQFDWLRSLRDQCQPVNTTGVPFFLKQVGSNPHGDWSYGDPPTYCLTTLTNMGLRDTRELSRCKSGRWKLQASRGNWPGEWPEDLRVREFPDLY